MLSLLLYWALTFIFRWQRYIRKHPSRRRRIHFVKSTVSLSRIWPNWFTAKHRVSDQFEDEYAFEIIMMAHSSDEGNKEGKLLWHGQIKWEYYALKETKSDEIGDWELLFSLSLLLIHSPFNFFFQKYPEFWKLIIHSPYAPSLPLGTRFWKSNHKHFSMLSVL